MRTRGLVKAIWLAGSGTLSLALPLLWWRDREALTFAEASHASLHLGLCAAAAALWGAAGTYWFRRRS
jgi:hypothetical protein